MPLDAATFLKLMKLRDLFADTRSPDNATPRAFTPEDQMGLPDFEGDDSPIPLPPVVRPSIFQRDPLVVGSPMIARLAKAMLDIDPLVKSKVSSITSGPTAGAMDLLKASGLGYNDFDKSSLLGAYDSGTKQIFLKPGLNELNVGGTLAHELTHAAAGHSEYYPARAEVLWGNPRSRLAEILAAMQTQQQPMEYRGARK